MREKKLEENMVKVTPIQVEKLGGKNRDKYQIFEEEINNLKEELNKLMEDGMECLFEQKQGVIDKEEIKNNGSGHYKTGGVEPIDLYESAGMLKHFALGNIIKYAFRNKDVVYKKDMEKIIHYASILFHKYGE